MKKNIHPKYYPEAQIICACGNSFKVGSTKERTEIEVCSACHPLYTGKKRVAKAVGQVEKFRKKLEAKKKFKKVK